MNEVELMFEDKAIKRGLMAIYTKQDALQFVLECQKQSVGILGIDAFRLFPDKNAIQPSMEDSIDFSGSSFKGNDIYSDALALISTRKPDMYFEIVCAS
ncbi:MAG: hypothetical protein JST49_03285 [Bacteroidetes bacterium]|nr:hypothetical protein [Bacteroidota bacterium]